MTLKAKADRITERVPIGKTRSAPVPVGNTRWMMGALLGVGVVVNNLDRLNLALASTAMAHSLHLSNKELGILLSSFTWTYALSQLPAGLILDRIGVRWVQRIATLIWTISCVLTATASGLGLVLLSRLLLGISEAPVLPAAMKGSSEWFPRAERGTATAMFACGSAIASVVGAPLLGLSIAAWGWRAAFWCTALVSVLFAAAWWILYLRPDDARRKGRLSAEEHEYIIAGGAQDANVRVVAPVAELSHVLRQRKMWGLSLGLGCAGYAQSLLVTWLPGFLQQQIGLSVAKSGFFTAIPAAAGVLLGFFVAGRLVDRRIRLGSDESRVRKSVIVAGVLMGFFVMGAGFTRDPLIAIFFLTIGSAGITLAFVATDSIPSLIAPRGCVGLVGSLMNFVNIAIGSLAPIVTGYLVDTTGTFLIAFVVCGGFLVASLFFYIVVLGRIEPLRPMPPAKPTTELATV